MLWVAMTLNSHGTALDSHADSCGLRDSILFLVGCSLLPDFLGTQNSVGDLLNIPSFEKKHDCTAI